MKKGSEKCPVCGSGNVVPIQYGLPTPEGGERAERGEIKLGGCIPLGPDLHCRDCEQDFPSEGERGRTN